jgi:hypothetical protein
MRGEGMRDVAVARVVAIARKVEMAWMAVLVAVPEVEMP